MSVDIDFCFNCDSKLDNSLKIEKFKGICPVCGAWIALLDKSIEFNALYGQDYYSGDEYLNYELGKNIHQKNFKRKVKLLSKYLFNTKEIRLLEIGSATGEFLKAARGAGWQKMIGIEISDYAREEAIKNGFKVLSPLDQNLNQVINDLNPNVVVLWDVWEHLEKPSEILNNYLANAPVGTLFSLTTVDAGSKNAIKRQEKWRQFHPPTHINYPTKKSFEIYFDKKAFRIKEHFYFGYFRPLSEYLAAVFGKLKFIKNSKFLFSIPFYLNLYDTQMVIAVKEK